MMKDEEAEYYFVGSTNKPPVPSHKMKCVVCGNDVWISEIEEFEKRNSKAICDKCYLKGELSPNAETKTLEKSREKLKEKGLSDEDIDLVMYMLKSSRRYSIMSKKINEKFDEIVNKVNRRNK